MVLIHTVAVGELVAIKKFKEASEDAVINKTTLREVKLLRLLRHENIVHLLEAFRRNGKLYLVFEFVDKNLLEVLTQLYPSGFSLELVSQTMEQLFRALHHCHKNDVMHRDIKPENLLINLKDMSVKLCDFGFARSLPIPGDRELTDYVATRWYRSPELLLGFRKYGPEVDIFALGCIMGEILDGNPLLPGDSELDQLSLIQAVISPLTRMQRHAFSSHVRFAGMELSIPPHLAKSAIPLEKRYPASRKTLDLMRRLLTVDGSLRVSAEQALRDPFFVTASRPSLRALREQTLRPGTTFQQPRTGRMSSLTLPARTYSRQSSVESLKEVFLDPTSRQSTTQPTDRRFSQFNSLSLKYQPAKPRRLPGDDMRY